MNKRLLLLLLGAYLVGGTSSYAFYWWRERMADLLEANSKQVRQLGEYQFINPLLECEVADGTLDARKENFHRELEAYITHLKEDRRLSDVAVYFRDMNNGPAFGVNQEDGFFPASLLKVPVMMTYYHLSEKTPNLLREEVIFEAPISFGIVPTILPKKSMEMGKSYTIEELIEQMIIYSDNQALYLLVNRIPRKEVQELFAMIGVNDAVLSDAHAKLNVKEYAGFFRILFNSSYLSRENSEKALSLLASTDYSDALPAGIPTGVLVAHKFGEAGTGESDRQLHDCGVVYFPNHPYLACIMTRGQNTESLKNSIRDISNFIYQKIDEQY